MANEPADSIATPRAGVLFLVATPIGNLGDLSPRARDLLRAADLLLAEDTRHTARLLHACAIERPAGSVVSFYEHNERSRIAQVIERLRRGMNVALVSDAGTPLVSDPGAPLVRAAIDAGIMVVAIPGPCAAVAALSVSGLPGERFAFEGFLPSRSAARRSALESLATEGRTLVFYEAPHRLVETLGDLERCLGGGRRAAIVREITKRHESAYRGSVSELVGLAAQDPDMARGEIVIVVAGAEEAHDDEVAADRVLRELAQELSASQAARLAAKITGRSRKQMYDRALALAKSRESPESDGGAV